MPKDTRSSIAVWTALEYNSIIENKRIVLTQVLGVGEAKGKNAQACDINNTDDVAILSRARRCQSVTTKNMCHPPCFTSPLDSYLCCVYTSLLQMGTHGPNGFIQNGGNSG